MDVSRLPAWVLALCAVLVAMLFAIGIATGRPVSLWPPTIGAAPSDKPNSAVSTKERIGAGETFIVAFSVPDTAEQLCLRPQHKSPLGDFLVGGAYIVRYDPKENKFHTRGLNQGKAGCPWEDRTGARPGSFLEDDRMILWGVEFRLDDSGRVTLDGKHAGYAFFPDE